MRPKIAIQLGFWVAHGARFGQKSVPEDVEGPKFRVIVTQCIYKLSSGGLGTCGELKVVLFIISTVLTVDGDKRQSIRWPRMTGPLNCHWKVETFADFEAFEV